MVAESHHELIAEPFAHDPDGGVQMKVIDVRTDAALASGGGGLTSTAIDYARFLQFMLNRGELAGVRLLGPRTVDFMTTDHLGDIPVFSAGSRALLPAGHGFGLGFAVRKHLGVAPVPGSENYKDALWAMDNYVSIHDSLTNVAKTKTITELEKK